MSKRSGIQETRSTPTDRQEEDMNLSPEFVQELRRGLEEYGPILDSLVEMGALPAHRVENIRIAAGVQ